MKGPLRKGATFERVLTKGLTRAQIVQYAGASGDFNPLHTDERYAVEVARRPGVFAHGMLTMGMAGQMVLDAAQPHGRVKAFGGRFRAPVYPGDTLRGRFTVEELTSSDAETVVHAAVEVLNQEGVAVFSGQAELVWPVSAGSATQSANVDR